MSIEMKSGNCRWTAKRKSVLVLDIFKGRTTISEASRTYDPPSPSEIEEWIEEETGGMENALRAKSHDIQEQYERKVKDLQEVYGESMLELRVRKKLQSLLDEEEK